MAVYRLSESEIWFPPPEDAEEDGLLAVGGDLSLERLVLAYSLGIFPWFNREDPILWWSPHDRFVIFPEDIHVSKSMKKLFKRQQVEIRINHDFRQVIHQCRSLREKEEGTWITDEMEQAYIRLYDNGCALCVESYIDGVLAGGLYGVALGRCFFGESMFSLQPNGSKAALVALARLLKHGQCVFIDCQFHTKHLERMGGVTIPWEKYKELLKVGFNNK